MFVDPRKDLPRMNMLIKKALRFGQTQNLPNMFWAAPLLFYSLQHGSFCRKHGGTSSSTVCLAFLSCHQSYPCELSSSSILSWSFSRSTCFTVSASLKM